MDDAELESMLNAALLEFDSDHPSAVAVTSAPLPAPSHHVEPSPKPPHETARPSDGDVQSASASATIAASASADMQPMFDAVWGAVAGTPTTSKPEQHDLAAPSPVSVAANTTAAEATAAAAAGSDVITPPLPAVPPHQQAPRGGLLTLERRKPKTAAAAETARKAVKPAAAAAAAAQQQQQVSQPAGLAGTGSSTAAAASAPAAAKPTGPVVGAAPVSESQQLMADLLRLVQEVAGQDDDPGAWSAAALAAEAGAAGDGRRASGRPAAHAGADEGADGDDEAEALPSSSLPRPAASQAGRAGVVGERDDEDDDVSSSAVRAMMQRTRETVAQQSPYSRGESSGQPPTGADPAAAAAGGGGGGGFAGLLGGLSGLAGLGGGLDGGDGGTGNVLIEGIMRNLLSKEMLYGPLQEIRDRYPPWLTDNEGKVPPQEFARFVGQYEAVVRVCKQYEDAPDDFTRIVASIQEMQEFGDPPNEIVDEITGGASTAGLFGGGATPAGGTAGGTANSTPDFGSTAEWDNLGDMPPDDALLSELQAMMSRATNEGGGGAGSAPQCPMQ